jgi:hypothetical protein
MTVGSKEFFDIMNQFEKDVQKITYGHSFDRAPLSKEEYIKGSFYNDGYVNTLFEAYLLGYAFKRYVDL